MYIYNIETNCGFYDTSFSFYYIQCNVKNIIIHNSFCTRLNLYNFNIFYNFRIFIHSSNDFISPYYVINDNSYFFCIIQLTEPRSRKTIDSPIIVNACGVYSAHWPSLTTEKNNRSNAFAGQPWTNMGQPATKKKNSMKCYIIITSKENLKDFVKIFSSIIFYLDNVIF